VARAVIFDWYGTLAEWEHASASSYAAVLTELGYEARGQVLDEYQTRWDGVDHRAHSTSREAYVLWSRSRLRALVDDCGVASSEADHAVDLLLEWDYTSPMVPYPEAIQALGALRASGLMIGVCSNWGWDLESFLEATGVAPFVDVAVTSARAGYRKPHPGIYEATLGPVGLDPVDAVFVGDTWGPDVVGPTGVGMAAVHVWRDQSRPAPELMPGTHRVTALDQLLSLPLFACAP